MVVSNKRWSWTALEAVNIQPFIPDTSNYINAFGFFHNTTSNAITKSPPSELKSVDVAISFSGDNGLSESRKETSSLKRLVDSPELDIKLRDSQFPDSLNRRGPYQFPTDDMEKKISYGVRLKKPLTQAIPKLFTKALAETDNYIILILSIKLCCQYDKIYAHAEKHDVSSPAEGSQHSTSR